MTPSHPPRIRPKTTAAGLLLAALALPLAAQVAPAPSGTAAKPAAPETAQVQVMEAFTVTGSNIRRIDQESTLPVTVIGTDDLDLRGVSTAAEIFDTLSIGGPITLDEGNTLGADARGDNNSINLRGIGSGNTLVLLNGRRMAPHPISQAESGVPSLSVNVNQLPAAAMARVEVLRDGASAIYGTDAAGGVVNSITRKNFDGLSLRARGSLTQHGGGNEWNTEITAGENFNGGKSNLLLTLDFFHRDFLWLNQRKFSRNQDIRVTRDVPAPWNGLPVTDSAGTVVRDNDFDNRLSTDSSYFGGFIRGSYDATGTFNGARPTGNRGIITTSGSTSATMATNGTFYLIPLADGNTGFRQTLPSHNIDDYTVNWFQNPNDYKPSLPKSDRLNLFGQVNHKVDENLTLFGEFMAYNARSITGRLPNAFDASTDHGIYMSASNPYNPFGVRFYEATGQPNADGTPRLAGTPADIQFLGGVGVIPRDFKPTRIVVDSEAYRAVGGLRGRFSREWEWESAVSYSRNSTRDVEHNAVRESRLRAALTSSDPAKAFNPFGYTFKLVPQVGNTTNPYLLMVDKAYSNPTALTESLYDDFIREGRTQLANWDLRVNGTAFDRFWGGPIGLAFGSEMRWEDYKDWRPPYAGLNPASAPYNGNPNDPTNLFFGPNENDFLGVSPNVNLYSSRTIASAFGEVLIPVVGKPNAFSGVRSLEVSIAGRFEHYSDFGHTAKPKFGLNYRPNSWMLFRATVASSFRAPNLVQTNPTPVQRSGNTYNDVYRSTVTGLNRDSNAVPIVLRQGSTTLTPESSRSISAGLGISAPFYRDLTITVDYWRIHQKDVIDDVTGTTQLLRDEELLDGAVKKALAAGTPLNQINLGSGTSSYVGNPKVVRNAVTPADIADFNAYNATRPASQQRAPVGGVRSVVTDYINLAGREVQGLDFGLELRLPKTRFGQLSIRGDASYLLQSDTEDEPGAAKVNNINRDGRTRFRGNIGGTWRKERWSAGWFTTYYGSYVDTGASTTKEIYEALGKPAYISVYDDSGGVRRYRYLVSPFATHNTFVNYAFPRNRRGGLFAGTAIRFGINNVTDIEPPLADEDFGYRRGAGTTAKGRTFYSQISKNF
ncbi:MAG: TonB-dependent receptor [Verrucomicrobia bacterium]|nr:TonB-dependent receptor [Verrucomicrobiota bacterium]